MKPALTLIFLVLVITLSSCSSSKELTESRVLPDEQVYFFSAREDGSIKAEPVEFNKEERITDVLDCLMNRLTHHFFGSDTSSAKTAKFELQKIDKIETDSYNYAIAVINISDPGKVMERIHFQGSAGGSASQNTILLTILQPQIDQFLDGCIILINGVPVGELDHLNLRGIKTAGLYDGTVRQILWNK